ncbi:hypothetical protein [Micromonospora sp. NBC_01796]|uniref:hypothetical protein n=1 Tax=Micromonospora sp. NBC_01796 TaxID=2975987 RepID=UPI002DD963E5|nr:hypothetical protein [Micromonospora sp. NBC_01796]WSA88081.1 hypothetical protein OIE47_10980 [Micromonospora sp. NBC_01796]
MTVQYAASKFLSDWRLYREETPMLSDKGKRIIDTAIHRQETKWQKLHQEAYDDRANRRFDQRDEKVVGACTEMRRRLGEIRRAIRNGEVVDRADLREFRAQIRDMTAKRARVTDLHETILAEDDELAAFAEKTVDEFQREQLGKFSVLPGLEPSLMEMYGQIEPEFQGGAPTTSGATPQTTDNAPTEDDIRNDPHGIGHAPMAF